MRFKEKVAIVTGAGQGIGEGIALRLASEGAHIVIAEINSETAHRTARKIEALQTGAHTYVHVVDVGDADAVEELVGAVIARFGQIDILINNAGVNERVDMLDLTPQQWRWLMHTNLDGVFYCSQAVGRQMMRQTPPEVRQQGRAIHSYGKIVNLSSVAGRRGRKDAAQYAASKAAVISITQSTAMRLAPFGINVNAVCPGLVWTPMWEYIDRMEGQERRGMAPGAYLQNRVEEKVPLRRHATVEDVAGVVAFLCSSEADYITGQSINIDGGYEMH